jgi:FMN phosphatase YigB (HAD superfamily)
MEGTMAQPKPYRVVFFDIGDTLVGSDRHWLPGAREALVKLHAQGTRLGLISNTGALTRSQVLAQLPSDFDLGMFEEKLIIMSSEVGIEKPALAIFLLAAFRAGVSPAECLFCTETLVHSLAAQRACMAAGRLQSPPNSDIAELVTNLDQLGVVIGGTT